jgi:hypothetical protein
MRLSDMRMGAFEAGAFEAIRNSACEGVCEGD